MNRFIMVVLLSGGALWSCGPAAATSSVCAATCTGCCDANGVCQLGTAANVCGIGGRACSSCGADEMCTIGSCLTKLVSSAGGSAAGGSAGGGSVFGGGSAGGTAGGVVRFDAGIPRSTCVGRLIDCNSSCIDPLTDEANCGGCGVQCGAGLVCNGGQCRALPQDCLADRCPDDFGCNPETRTCARQCFSNADCRVAGSTCVNGGCLCGGASAGAFAPRCQSCTTQTVAPWCRCDSGYVSDQTRGCVDLDECAAQPGICGAASAARCVNQLGAYSCECLAGFVKVNGVCVRDLCASGNGGCAATAYCSMVSATERSCRCPSGSIGDGLTCKPTCSVSVPCPSGLSCYPDPQSSIGGVCDRPGFGEPGELCGSHGDCVAGTLCERSGAVGFCAKGCSTTSSCGTGERCVLRSSTYLCLKANNTLGCDMLKQDCEGGCYPGGDGDGGVLTICAPAGSSTSVCNSLNGCTRGSACLERAAGGFECVQACDLSAPQCRSGGACGTVSWLPGVGLCG